MLRLRAARRLATSGGDALAFTVFGGFLATLQLEPFLQRLRFAAALPVLWLAAAAAVVPARLLLTLADVTGLLRDHAQIGEVHLAVPRIEQLELHVVQTQRQVGAHENRLVRIFLQPRERRPLLVLKIKGNVRVHGEFDAHDTLVVHRDLQPPHHVEAHALGGFDQARSFAVRAVIVDRSL